MLQQTLLLKYGYPAENLIKEALQIASRDIYVNRVLFNKKTNLSETLLITERCLQVLLQLEKCA